MPNWCAILADMIVVFHLLVVVFVVGSLFLIVAGRVRGWQWIRNFAFRLSHLLMVAFITAQSLVGELCPLTIWEYRLRQRAGQFFESDMSFMARLFRMMLFYDLPEWFFTVMYAVFGVIVVAAFFLIPPQWPFGRQSRNY